MSSASTKSNNLFRGALILSRSGLGLKVFLALLLSWFLVGWTPGVAFGVTSAEKQAEADQIEAKIDELQTKLNETNAEIERATAAYETAKKAAEQARKEALAAAQKVKKLQGELAERANYLYRNGNTSSYMDVLLGAASFKDFLTSWDAVSRIIHHDTELIDETKTVRKQAEDAEAEYNAQSKKAEEEMNAANEAKTTLETTKNQMEVELAKVTEEVALLKAQEEEIRLAEEAAKARAAEAERLASSVKTDPNSGFIHPVPGAQVSSEFGWRPWSGTYHQGIDLAIASGTPIVAAKAGTVSYVGVYGGGGNTVIINHGNGLRTLYLHQSAFNCTVGQQVSQGQCIGYVGSTGHSTGPHLHFQVEINNTPVNPRRFVSF